MKVRVRLHPVAQVAGNYVEWKDIDSWALDPEGWLELRREGNRVASYHPNLVVGVEVQEAEG